MKYYAQINKINHVVQVVNLDDKKNATWLEKTFGGVWIQTTKDGSIRKNYAGIGYTYDKTRDAFIPPTPFTSWVLDEETCQWEAPTPYSEDGKAYSWDEDTVSWVEVPTPVIE